MNDTKILAFSGSARRESYNQRLVENAAKLAGKKGANVTVVNLRDFPMPFMDQDLERKEGVPDNALKLKAMLVRSDGLMLASPEYNSSVTPLLKNAIDWMSRRVGDEPPMIAYKGKVTALLSASPGRLGGMRSLLHMRGIMSNLGALVLPVQMSVAQAGDAFGDDDSLVREFDRNKAEELVTELLRVTRQLAES